MWANIMFKILGTDDSVNTCDCCGKSNLKSTVIVEVDGEILHYGSVCATRHTKMSSKEINNAIKIDHEIRRQAAVKEYFASNEYTTMTLKGKQASMQKLVGVSFSEFCRIEQDKADSKRREIAAKFNLKSW